MDIFAAQYEPTTWNICYHAAANYMRDLLLVKKHFFSFRNFNRQIILIPAVLLCAVITSAQSDALSYTAVDSSFTMQLDREKTDVKIILTFSDSLTFDYVSIEKKADNPEYSQCKYISYSDLKAGSRHLVEKDMYPYAGSSDVLYRLKLITKEGIIRIFPPISLPAIKK